MDNFLNSFKVLDKVIIMLKSEVEAEEFEKQAKQELKNKNYEVSKSIFEKARDIYLQLNYMGKVNVIEKQIAQIKRVLEYEKQSKKPIANKINTTRKEQENEKSIIVTEINKKNAIQELETKIDKSLDNKKQILSEAELRRAKLREQMAKKEKEADFNRIQDAKIKDREDKKKQELLRKDEELRIKIEKEKEKDGMKKIADDAMNQAKMAIENKQFNEAKAFYKKAIDIFKTIGWFDQVDILYREIQLVEKYKIDYLEKKALDDQKRQKREELFQKRVDALLEEDNQKKRMIKAKFMKLSPEIRRIIDKINLLIEKAEKEVNANIYERALNRYQYILELYNSIPPDKIDLTTEIAEINKKIEELKTNI